MPAKQLSFNDEARQAMGRGVSIVGAAVATTLGPKGRNVVDISLFPLFYF